jgi:hypothetical protein
MPSSNLIQILIFILVLAGPVIGKIGTWMVAQKKKRDAELNRRKREEESFRTGRDTSTEPAGPTPEQLEQLILAEQLRQQQEEMLRQREAQAEARRRAAQQRAEAARKAKQESAAAFPVPAPAVQARASEANRSSAAVVKVNRVPAPSVARATGSRSPSAAVLSNLDKDSLRQAIIMTEILGPPVAMRDEHMT